MLLESNITISPEIIKCSTRICLLHQPVSISGVLHDREFNFLFDFQCRIRCINTNYSGLYVSFFIPK